MKQPLNAERPFTLMRSDIEGISEYVIAEMKRRKLELTESARKVQIAKAIKVFRELGLRAMREAIIWELDLLPAFQRNSDKPVDICETGKMRKRVEVSIYLESIGLTLELDGIGYWTTVPKTYDVTGLRKRLSTIIGRKV